MLKFFPFLFVMFMSNMSFSQENYSLSIEFDGLSTEKGKLFISLYNTEIDFLKNAVKRVEVGIKNGKAIAYFDNLERGVYAISSFHDKNNNGKMDTNFLGMPKEPVACSNNAKGSFGPPKFKDAKFNINNEDLLIKITF